MVTIFCAKCKNACLKKEDGVFRCPACEAVFPLEDENLLLGAQYYNEGDYEKCDDCLMKFIVKFGAEPRALFYKALSDGFRYDEDTSSLSDIYERLAQSLSEISDDELPKYLAVANDDCEKLEASLAEMHIRKFETADAEAIKKLVSILITLQNDAKEFRAKLTEFADAYNKRATNKLSVRFSKCMLVNTDLAAEVGALKFDRIAESIASHTVFTGILSTDIKNLEIYYRCIVMFFEKNRQKYDFLMASAEKFSELANLLEDGKYSAIKGTSTIGDRLKGAAYDFFQESLKDNDDDEDGDVQTQSVVVIESETVDIPDTAQNGEDKAEGNIPEPASDDIEYEDVFSSSDVGEPVDKAEERAEFEDISSDSSSDETENNTPDEATTEENAPSNENTPESAESESVDVDDVDDVVDIEGETDDSNTVSEEISNELTSDGKNEVDEETVTGVVEIEVDTAPSEDVHVFENPEVTDETAEEIPIEEIVESTVVFDSLGTVDSKKQELEDVIVDVAEVPEANNSEEDIAATRTIDSLKKNTVEPTTPDDEETHGSDSDSESAARVTAKHKKSYGPFVAVVLSFVIAAGILAAKIVPPKIKESKYEQAAQYTKDKQYLKAAEIYDDLGDYEESELNAKKCRYAQAELYENDGKHKQAKEIYLELGDYSNSATKATLCTYNGALADLEAENFDEAIAAFKTISEYSDSAEQIKICNYRKALSLIDKGGYKSAISLLESLDGYMSSSEKILEAKYLYVKSHLDSNDEATMTYIKELVAEKYQDSASLRKQLLTSDKTPSTSAPATDTAAATTPATTQAPAETTRPSQKSAVKTFVNYSKTDNSSAETKVDGSKKIYFHMEVTDPQYYGKNLKLYYKTSVGYTSSGSTVRFDKNNTTDSFEYSSTFSDEYTLEFELRDENGKTIASQKVSVNA